MSWCTASPMKTATAAHTSTMAAQRAGVRKVLLPKDNVDDLRDVPEEVREKLEIVPVETVEEVLKLTGIKSAAAAQA